LTEPSKDANEFTLVISEKGGAERRQVFRSAEVAIGRVPGNDIVLAKGNVSKKHARLLFREGRLIVTDLNSTNGTFVNRRRIAQATIVRPEDRLFIGDYVFRVELTGASADVLSLDTPERLMAPPLPGTVLKLGGDGETTGPLATLVPSPDRITEPPSARSSSGSSPRKGEEPSGRFQEPSALRAVVGGIVNSVLQARAELPPEIDDLVAQSLGDQLATLLDQLLVDGQIPVGVAGETVHDVAFLELTGLGPLESLLDDASVSAVSASRFDELVEVRDGRLQASQSAFSCPRALDLAIVRLLHRAKAPRAASERFTRTTFVRGAYSWRAEFAKVGESWIFNMERTAPALGSGDDWVRRGVLSRAMANFLNAAMQARLNLLIVAAIPGDARELVQVLLGSANRERVFGLGPGADVGSSRVTLVDIPPDDPGLLGVLRLAARLPLARLVFATTDEVAWPSVLEQGPLGGASLLCMAEGGDLGRVLGRMPADLVRRTPGVSIEVAGSWIEGAFDIAVEVSRHVDGRIRITRIAEVQKARQLSDVFSFQVTRTLSGGGTEGSFVQVAKDPQVSKLFQAAGLRPDQVLPARSTDPGELK
jgi:pSer/pThr/pTyr-binding forkhead associated (FHA) protein